MHRRESPTTSADAANDINTTFLEEMVFSVIESHGGAGCISDDVRAALSGLSYSSVTARYKALAEKGMIVYPGSKRKGESGRSQQVMIARTMVPHSKRSYTVEDLKKEKAARRGKKVSREIVNHLESIVGSDVSEGNVSRTTAVKALAEQMQVSFTSLKRVLENDRQRVFAKTHDRMVDWYEKDIEAVTPIDVSPHDMANDRRTTRTVALSALMRWSQCLVNSASGSMQRSLRLSTSGGLARRVTKQMPCWIRPRTSGTPATQWATIHGNENVSRHTASVRCDALTRTSISGSL